MFRPFRPTVETLEKREVFSAGPLDSVAALGDQPIAPHSTNEVAIETIEVSHTREQQRPDGNRVPSIVVDPNDPNVVYLHTAPFADGLVLELRQRQITATYNGDSNFSAVLEPNDERPWSAAARDDANNRPPAPLTSGFGFDFNPTLDQVAGQSGELGLDVWEHAVTDRDTVLLEKHDHEGSNGLLAGTYGRGVAAGDINGDGRDDVVAISGDTTDDTNPRLQRAIVDDLLGGNFLLPYIEQDNLYKSSQAHDRLFAELGSGNDLWSRHNSHSQILIGLLLP